MSSQQFLYMALIAYVFSCAGSFLPRGKRWIGALALVAGMVLNALAVGLRYWYAWPMLPMYWGLPALPLCMGIIICAPAIGETEEIIEKQRLAEHRNALALIVLLTLLTVLFPRDFYLPFLRSKTIFSHLFLLCGVVGKAFFFLAAARAMAFLLLTKANADNIFSVRGEKRILRCVVWGFVFWTCSMFAGEIWSYIGWGTPVVWEDPAITMTMATWFYYICLLHLHLTKTWNIRQRIRYTAAGALVTVILNCYSDLGPFRRPF